MTTVEVKTTEMINKLFIPELADIILSYYIEPNEHKVHQRLLQEIKHYAYDTMYFLNARFIVNYDVDQNIIGLTSHWGNSDEYWNENENYGRSIVYDSDKNTFLWRLEDPPKRTELHQKYVRAIWEIPYEIPLAMRRDFKIYKRFKGNLREKLLRY